MAGHDPGVLPDHLPRPVDDGAADHLPGRRLPPVALHHHAELAAAGALELPTFEVGGQVLLRRLTLVVRDGVVEDVWYPVSPPDSHAQEVLSWLQANPR
jgi:hypothetical protein